MKSPPWIYPQFISPMSGRIIFDGLQALTTDYTFLGDRNGFVIESPILKDIRLDIIQIRSRLGTTPFLLQEATAGFDNSQALNEVSNGLIMNSGGFIVPASLTFNNFWVGSSENRPIETSTIPGGSISLLYNNVFVGNISNLATAQPTINFGNLPNLTYKNIWRGDNTNRPIESTDLTTAESSLSTTIQNLSNLANIVSAISNTVDALSSSVAAIEAGLASIGGFAAIILLQAQVIGLIAAVAALSSRLDNDENNITILQNQVSTINSQISTINSQISSINSQLSSINSQLTTINSEITAINSNLSSINSQLVLINSQISTIITDINNLANATYIIQTANSALPNAQVLGLLSTGLVKNTTTTGVLSIGIPGTDYYSPGNPTTLIEDYTVDIDPLLSIGNLGMGTHVLHSLTLYTANTGNTGIGSDCLYSFTTGSANTAVGRLGLYSLVSGSGNTVEGFGGGYLITSGSNNTLIGALGGFSMITGTGNSFVGYQTGQHDNLTDCCFFGRGARSSSNGLTNAIAIGATATVATSNSMVLGNNVSVGIGTTSPAYPLDVVGVAGISINANTNRIINVNTPISGLDAVNKNYVDTKPLNTFAVPTGDVSLNNFKITNLANPISNQDAVNLITLNNAISSLNITLAGFVLGGPAVAGVLTTTRGPTCLLTNIPAGGNVDMGGNSLQNLAQSPIATLDAISAQFLWDLIHDNVNVTWVSNISTNVFTAGHINPDLSIEGQSQRFIFGYPLLPEPAASFRLDNIYVPIIGSPSSTDSEIRNNVLSGYRWRHTTQSTETYGSYRLQKFLYANPTGTDLITFNDNGTFSIPGLTDAKYIIQTAAANLPNAQVLGSLSSGIIKNTTTTGVLSIATNGTDYYSPGNPTTLLDDYNAISLIGNLSVGTNSLSSLVLGSNLYTNNTSIGPNSLASMTLSGNNTSVGRSSLYKLTSNSNNNTSMGVSAGFNLTSSCSDNCFYGMQAGLNYTSSLFNCLFGFASGGNVDNLQNCSFFGATAGATNSNLTNANAIGYSATVATSNSMVLGNGLNVGIGESSPTYAKLCIVGGVANVASEDSSIRATGSSNATKIEINNTAASGRLYELRSDNAGNFVIGDRTGSASRLTINSNGFVGIGESSPTYAELCVVGGVANVASEDSSIRATGSSNATKIEINNTSASGHLYELRSDNGGNFVIADRTAAATARLVIGSTGNVGIGSGSNAPLQFAAINANRKIVLIEVGNNDNQVYAIGAPSGQIRFQLAVTTGAFTYFAGTSSSASNEVARITGAGALLISRIANNANAPSVTPTVSLGAVGVVGTGATSSLVGGEVGGRFTLNTGTGVLTTGTIATFTLASAMPSSTFSVIFYPASGAISLNANSTSSTQFTISNTGLLGLTASTTYVWNYQIVGY
jgi:prefoldin subunit 5